MNASATISESGSKRRALQWGLGLGALLFGIVTLVSGGKVLFGAADARAEAGNVVDFVLIFNFGAGFLYVAAGVATALAKRLGLQLARGLAVLTVLVFAALGVHIAFDGAFETRTVMAMTLRSVFWIAQALALAYLFRNQAPPLRDPR